MSLITDKLYEDSLEREGDGSSIFLPIFLALCVVMIAMFIGEMLFGKNSLEVYLQLKKDEQILDKKIYYLKNENATLQKKYFELKNVMPTSKEEE